MNDEFEHVWFEEDVCFEEDVRAEEKPRPTFFQAHGSRMATWCVSIIGLSLLGGAVFLASMPPLCCGSNRRTTRQRAETVRSAVMMFRAENPRACPSTDDLMEGDYLDRGRRTTDAWDRDYRIVCSGRGVEVSSAGPDGEFQTMDDVDGLEPVDRALTGMRRIRAQLAHRRGLTLAQLEEELRHD